MKKSSNQAVTMDEVLVETSEGQEPLPESIFMLLTDKISGKTLRGSRTQSVLEELLLINLKAYPKS